MRKIYTLLLFMFSLHYLAFSQVTVSGSGCSPVACFVSPTAIDDTYTVTGTSGDGRNVYANPTGIIIIQFSGG